MSSKIDLVIFGCSEPELGSFHGHRAEEGANCQGVETG